MNIINTETHKCVECVDSTWDLLLKMNPEIIELNEERPGYSYGIYCSLSTFIIDYIERNNTRDPVNRLYNKLRTEGFIALRNEKIKALIENIERFS